MSYSKNDCVELTIEDIGVSGEGIGKVDGYTLFVKDTVIGDVVRVKIMKAKKNYRRKQGHRQPYTKVEIKKIK